MTNNRHRLSRRHNSPTRIDSTPRNTNTALHEQYVSAVNAALQDGRDNVAHEIAAAYADDLRRADFQHAA